MGILVSIVVALARYTYGGTAQSCRAGTAPFPPTGLASPRNLAPLPPHRSPKMASGISSPEYKLGKFSFFVAKLSFIKNNTINFNEKLIPPKFFCRPPLGTDSLCVHGKSIQKQAHTYRQRCTSGFSRSAIALLLADLGRRDTCPLNIAPRASLRIYGAGGHSQLAVTRNGGSMGRHHRGGMKCLNRPQEGPANRPDFCL